MDRRAQWISCLGAVAIVAIGALLFESASSPEISRSTPSNDVASVTNPPSLAPEVEHDRIEGDVTRELAESLVRRDESPAGPGIMLVVVDADGRPLADMPIAWGLARDARADGYPPYRASTDREGRVHFDASEIHALEPKDSKEILRFTFVGTFDVPSWIECTLAEAELAPVELRLPPTATVFVDVYAAGFPLNELAEVSLEVRANRESEFSPHSTTQLRQARATFPLVPIGWEVRAKASHRSLTAMTSLEPPAIAIRGGGPPIRIDFPPIAFFSLRLVTHDGLPLPDTKFTIGRFGGADGERAHPSGATDRLGRTTIAWPISSEDHRGAALRLKTEGSPYLGSAEVSVGDRLVAATVDLGDVWLHPPPILAAGRVLDTNGRPRTHAMIAASILRIVDSKRRRGSHLEDATLALTQTDEFGAFEIRHETAESSVRILVHSDSIAPDVFTVPAGSTGLVLRLAGRGSVAGTLDLSGLDSKVANEICVSLYPVDSSALTSVMQLQRQAKIDLRGAFRFDDLPPGRYRVDIFHVFDTLKSLQVDLDVVVGEVVLDERLQGVKLEP